MKYIFYLTLLIAGAIGVWSCNEEVYVEPAQLTTIRGRVLYSVDQRPVSNATIKLSPSSRIINTDSLGNFRFDSVLVGKYTVEVTKANYATEVATVETNVNTSPVITILLSDETRQNTAPTSPTLVTPAINSTVQPVNLTLKWSATDPNRDTLTYDVLLYRNGSLTPTSSVTGLTVDSLVVNLDYNSSYLWQVIVKDGVSTVNGPIWSFRTGAFPEYNYVFTRRVNGRYQIFASNTAGNVAQFTFEGSNWRPIVSPNGQQIAYISNVDTELQLYVMNSDGSNIRRVTTVPVAGLIPTDLSFCWSPDGTQLLYPSNDRLYSVRTDGTGLQLVHRAWMGRTFAGCDWTPQGNRIVFRSTGTNVYDNEIVTIKPDGSESNLLYVRRMARISNPVFSINGRTLIFSSDSSNFVNEQARQLDARLYQMDITTKKVTEVTTSSSSGGTNKPAGTNDLEPRYSPNGARIIFTNTDNTGNGVRSVYAADLNGGNRNLLITDAEMPYWRQ
ncbi:carboxypeptidase regulatory-like domain-containing protein [Spirosoma fluminis]